MRAVWIDKDATPQTAKLQTVGVTRVYFDCRDTPRNASGFERGIYRVQSWDNLAPAAFANALSADVARWGGDPYRQLAVHANIELHDPVWLISFLTRWRQIRPSRDTSLVLEGLQAGWFTPQLLGGIIASQVTVLAEAYTGDMSPIDADDVRSNLINYGVPRSHSLVMYDAARLAPYWDGCAFTQQRLP